MIILKKSYKGGRFWIHILAEIKIRIEIKSIINEFAIGISKWNYKEDSPWGRLKIEIHSKETLEFFMVFIIPHLVAKYNFEVRNLLW